MTDEQFLQALETYLGPDADTPFFYATDGSIDKEKTLTLPCYETFQR